MGHVIATVLVIPPTTTAAGERQKSTSRQVSNTIRKRKEGKSTTTAIIVHLTAEKGSVDEIEATMKAIVTITIMNEHRNVVDTRTIVMIVHDDIEKPSKGTVQMMRNAGIMMRTTMTTDIIASTVASTENGTVIGMIRKGIVGVARVKNANMFVCCNVKLCKLGLPIIPFQHEYGVGCYNFNPPKIQSRVTLSYANNIKEAFVGLGELITFGQ
jgi:hypothetical protein